MASNSKTTLYFSERDLSLFEKMNDLKKQRGKAAGSMSGYAREGIQMSGMLSYLNMNLSQGAMIAISRGMFDALQRTQMENGDISITVKEEYYNGDKAVLKDDIAALREFLG